MKNSVRITTCVLAAISLSGCQNFVSAFNFGSGAKQANSKAASEIFGKGDLDKGRLALQAGAPGNAIQHFRMAALNRDTAGDAFNGLGVAYAKLGRADLAERYFKMAVSMDAANPRYAANLARFYDSDLANTRRALAVRQAEAELTLASAANQARELGLLEAPEQTETRIGAVTLSRPATRLVRNSNREIALSTTPQSSEPAVRATEMAVVVRNPRKAQPVEEKADAVPETSEAETKEAKPVRVSTAGPAQASPYPVRIAIAQPRSAAKVQSAERGYPVRVAITSPSDR